MVLGVEITVPSSVTMRSSASVPISSILMIFGTATVACDGIERVDVFFVVVVVVVEVLVTRVARFAVE